MPLLQLLPVLSNPSASDVTIRDNDFPGIPTFAAICVPVPPSATTNVTPWPTIGGFPTLRPLPALPITVSVSTTATTTATATLSAWLAPAATMDTWSEAQFGDDPWEKGRVDGELLAAQIGGTVGWLAILFLLGPLAMWVPLLIIRANVGLSARVVLAVIKFVKGILR
jgi:hypothetical protein